MDAEEFDLKLSTGLLHAKRHGSPSAPLVLCAPGLTANLCSFDYLGQRLGDDQRQLVVLDLRGRGRSEVTPPGSYAYPSHARDLLEVADILGAGRFTIVGHSMGAVVGMEVARRGRGRLQRLALIDAVANPTDPSVTQVIRQVVARLGTVYPSVAEYISLVRSVGAVRPWSDYWERYFEYELGPADGGVTPRTNREAAIEDMDYIKDHDPRGLWPALDLPVLVVRGAQPLLPDVVGPLLSDQDRDCFREVVPHAEVVEVDANHYGVITDLATVEALRRFLTTEVARPKL